MDQQKRTRPADKNDDTDTHPVPEVQVSTPAHPYRSLQEAANKADQDDDALWEGDEDNSDNLENDSASSGAAADDDDEDDNNDDDDDDDEKDDDDSIDARHRKTRRRGGRGGARATRSAASALEESKKRKRRTHSCQHPNCNTGASYNYVDEKPPKFCSIHKEPGMVNLRSLHRKVCIHVDCNKTPSFNTEGEKVSLYCSNHRLPGMVNVLSKRCSHPNCTMQPNFNYPGRKSRKGSYCLQHKLPGMVNTLTKCCAFSGCPVIPSFNFPGETVKLFCAKHRLDGMVNVQVDRLMHSRNFQGKGRPTGTGRGITIKKKLKLSDRLDQARTQQSVKAEAADDEADEEAYAHAAAIHKTDHEEPEAMATTITTRSTSTAAQMVSSSTTPAPMPETLFSTSTHFPQVAPSAFQSTQYRQTQPNMLLGYMPFQPAFSLSMPYSFGSMGPPMPHMMYGGVGGLGSLHHPLLLPPQVPAQQLHQWQMIPRKCAYDNCAEPSTVAPPGLSVAVLCEAHATAELRTSFPYYAAFRGEQQ